MVIDPLVEEVKTLRRRADQQATQHAWLRDYYERVYSAITTISLVFGALLLAIVMAPQGMIAALLRITVSQTPWVAAFAAAISYSVIVLQLAWRLDVRAAQHDNAVRRYTKAKYHASLLLKGGALITPSEVQRLESEYLDDRDLPRIPERYFLQSKQWHLIKVEYSRALDSDPYLDVSRLSKPPVPSQRSEGEVKAS